MPTREEELFYVNAEIEKLNRRLAGYEDRSLRGERHSQSYSRTIEQKQRLIAERDRLRRALQRTSDKGRRIVTGFAHSVDYRSVTAQGKNYTLTSRQAQMIGILHDAHERGRPDVAIDHVLEELGTKNSRWQDTFKSNPAAKKALIRNGQRKGTLRLNL